MELLTSVRKVECFLSEVLPHACHLDLEGLLDLPDDSLSVFQLHSQTLSISHLSPDGGCSHLHWRGLRTWAKLISAGTGGGTNGRNMFSFHCLNTHRALWFVSIILPFLHGCGHLVHGGDDGAAGLTQRLWAIQALRAVHLKEKIGFGLQMFF